MKDTEQKIFYRYEVSYSWGGMLEVTDIYLRELYLIKETKECYLVSYDDEGLYDKKLIHKFNLNSPSGYCAETKKKALEQFINRTNKRIEWYKFYLKNCENAIRIAENLKL